MGRDKYTNNEIALDYLHYLVHNGQMYHAHRYFEVTQASSQDFFLCTGAKDTHAIFEVAVSGKAIVYLYEGVTVNGNTVASINPTYNMERASVNTCLSYCGYGTGYSTKTEVVLETILLPGGGGPASAAKVGAEARSETEWIMKPSTRYMLRVTNADTNTITSHVAVEFYELDV